MTIDGFRSEQCDAFTGFDPQAARRLYSGIGWLAHRLHADSRSAGRRRVTGIGHASGARAGLVGRLGLARVSATSGCGAERTRWAMEGRSSSHARRRRLDGVDCGFGHGRFRRRCRRCRTPAYVTAERNRR